MNANVALAILLMLQAPSSHRSIFVVDKVSQVGTARVYGNTAHAQEGEHHSAPVVIAEFSKKCPTVIFTKNKESADFILETQPGASALSNQRGDVLYVSPAKTLKNMTKDVCGYITSH